MPLALLLAILASVTAAAEPVVRAGVEWAAPAADHRTGADEVVAGIVEGSVSGSLDRLDTVRTYGPDRGTAPAASRGRAREGVPMRSAPKPSSSAPATPGRVNAGMADRAVSSRTPLGTPSAEATEHGSTDESVIGFGLLVGAGIAGALLFIGAGRRMNAPAPRR